MSRRSKPEKPEILPDVRYSSPQVQSFINRIMRNGKKSVAAHMFYDAMDMIEERAKRNPVEVFDLAMKMSPLSWKSSLAVSAALPIRCLWRYLQSAGLPWLHVGSWPPPRRARVSLSLKNWLVNC